MRDEDIIDEIQEKERDEMRKQMQDEERAAEERSELLHRAIQAEEEGDAN